MKTQTDPKVDYAFKHVFGREQSKPALKSLLNAILQPAAGEGIVSLELINPFNEKTSESAKLSIVDIKARDESGRQFFIEMQMLANDDFRQRALYYWAALYQEQLLQGEDWRELRPTIEVCFVDTPLLADSPDYHSVFELRERRRQTLFTDQLAVHILELPKFKKGIDELTTLLDCWLYFLRHGEQIDAEVVPESLNVPELCWALGDLLIISRTDPDRELYEAALRERRDKASLQRTSEARGRAEGFAEGLAEGAAKARADLRRADIQTLQKSLRQKVTPLEQLQALSWDELDAIWARLHANLQAPFDNRQ